MSLDIVPFPPAVRAACAVLDHVDQFDPDASEPEAIHRSIDGILEATTRLKLCLGAGWLDAARREGGPTVWETFDSRFRYVGHDDPAVKDGLLRLAVGAIWLSGYAMHLRLPEEWRRLGVARLIEGLRLLLPELPEEARGGARKHLGNATELDELEDAVAGLCYFPERGYVAVDFAESTNQGVYRLNRYEPPTDRPEDAPNHRAEIERLCREIQPQPLPDAGPVVVELYRATVEAFRECSLAVGLAPFLVNAGDGRRHGAKQAEYAARSGCLRDALDRAERALLAARAIVIGAGEPNVAHRVLEAVRRVASWFPADYGGFDYIATRHFDGQAFGPNPFVALLEHARRLVLHESLGDQKTESVGQYVTLNQMAAIVNRGKSSLEKRLKTMPPPAVKGGGGKTSEWLWETVRPWLEREFGKPLPEKFPEFR